MHEQPEKYHDLIYDVGMHKGEDTDYYLKKGFKVIAFEADPNLVAECKKKFADDINKGNLTIVEGAIIEFTSEEAPCNTIRFFRNNDVSVWGTVKDDWASRNESLGTSSEIIEVPAINFSKCLQQYGIPHYLKVDIEGMDTICLKALFPFEQKPDYISIESDKVSFEKLKEELKLFMDLGYTDFKAINQAKIALQKEPEFSKEGSHIGYKFQNGSSGLFASDLSYEWQQYQQILKRYKSIFRGYKWIGDNGIIRHCYTGRILLKIIKRLTKNSVPGWYDTHAKHISVNH